MQKRRLLKIGACCALLSFQLNTAYALSVSGIDNADALKNVQARIELSEKGERYKGLKREERIKEDVLKAVQPYGYYTPVIKVYGNHVTVRLGTPVKIKQVQLALNGPGRHIYQKMPKKIPLVQGEIFKSEDYEDTKQLLLDAAEQHGYLHPKIKKSHAIVNLDEHAAYIQIEFDTGPRYFFGPFRFKRKTPYAEDFLRRYIGVKPGQPYSTDDIITLNDNFNGSGYFNRVTIRPHIRSKSTTVPVDIILKPKVSQQYSIGFGFGTDTGARGRLGVQLLQLNPYGHTLQFLLLGSTKQSALEAQYLIPGANPLTQQYHLSARAFQLDYPVGKSFGQLFFGGFIYHHKDARLTASINLLNEPTTYRDREKIQTSLFYPSVEAQLRHVEDPLFSKRGFNIIFNINAATDKVLARENFLQAQINAKAAIWLPTKTRLYFRGELGRTLTDDLFQLPLSMQLLAGGAESIRGYNFQSLGPGRKKYIVSLEVQQEVVENWFVTAFYDRGAVYDPSKRRSVYSVGGGIMWASPVGAIKVGLASPIATDKSRLKLIFSMGPDL